MATTLAQAYFEIEQRLRAVGIAESCREAELLVRAVTGCSVLDVHTHPERTIDTASVERLDRLVEQRVQSRVPIQYLVGSVVFYGLDVAVTPAVLIPRPETETLVAGIVATYRRVGVEPRRILDIGCGSGCIALALAHEFRSAQVVGWDVSESALAVAHANAERNGIANAIFERVDVFDCVPLERRFDLIVSNPPYIAADEYAQLEPELHHEPRVSLTDDGDGLRFFRRFAELFPDLLSADGCFALECGFGQSHAVAELLADAKAVIASDEAGIERFVIGSYCFSHPVLRNFSLHETRVLS